MRSTIDAAGRVVVPKVMRERLGLTGGRAIEIRERDGRLEIEPAQVILESYSVLTRLPAPHTAAAGTVREFLQLRFPALPLVLSSKAHAALMREAVGAGIVGGAIYDALIAFTAKSVGAALLTRDRRALPTYEKIGVRFELIG